MENKSTQKVVLSNLQVSIEQTQPLNDINIILDDGYEVEDVVPFLEEAGGAIYKRSHGLYVDNALFILSQSDKKSQISCRTIKKDSGFLDRMNDIIENENNIGFRLLKVMPLFGFIDPEAGQGIGKGTFAFELFFVSN